MKNIRERIYLSREQLADVENTLITMRHVERYGMVRQWLSGSVIDCACGVGYGTYLCSKNPDVRTIKGVDVDADAISYARSEYSADNLEFICGNIETFYSPADILLSLETLEHLKDPADLVRLALRCRVHTVIVSYPTKKTTHYNPYHYHDFKVADVLSLFNAFSLVDNIHIGREFRILRLSL